MRLNKTASTANFAAIALLGAVLAYWSWIWLAPAAAARAPAAVDAANGTTTANGLFGVARQGAGAAASGSIRLIGVMAASGSRRGHAVLRMDGKTTVAVLQGDEIEPGLRLAEVHVDHIVMERSGAREVLAWPEKK
jgi:general secretion pathway protein C